MKKIIIVLHLFIFLLSCDPGQTLIVTNYGRPNTSVGLYMDKRGLSGWEDKGRGKIVIYVPVDSTGETTYRENYRIGSWGPQKIDTLTKYIDSIVIKNEYITYVFRDSVTIKSYLTDHTGSFANAELTIAPDTTLKVNDCYSNINKYVKLIDKLKNDDLLIAKPYPQMSICGGSMTGYYKGGHMVHIESKYSAEYGYSMKNIYFKDTCICKIIYTEHHADWEKYFSQHPNDTLEINEDKLSYTDTTYIYTFEKQVTCEKRSSKYQKKGDFNTKQLKQLLYCARKMRKEITKSD